MNVELVYANLWHLQHADNQTCPNSHLLKMERNIYRTAVMCHLWCSTGALTTGTAIKSETGKSKKLGCTFFVCVHFPGARV